jgi:hypothetical protein
MMNDYFFTEVPLVSQHRGFVAFRATGIDTNLKVVVLACLSRCTN